MQIPAALLTAFPPSRQLSLDVARRQVNDGMLREIAEADYGCAFRLIWTDAQKRAP